MAFIDIFNFKKYFATPSDSQVARYGHVNALYNATQPKFTVGSVNQATGSVLSPVTINSTSGKIIMGYVLPSSLPTGFTVNNTEVTSQSIILITPVPQDNGDRTLEIIVNCSNIEDGSFRINAQLVGSGSATTTAPIAINFLVINP